MSTDGLKFCFGQVDHGWSMLDIAKHSTSSFVSSLEVRQQRS
jgi:hypothetical protein